MLRLAPLCLVLSAAAPAQSIPEDTGWNDLAERLFGAVPTGAGVVVGQVEAAVGSAYAPDPNHPEFVGKQFTLVSPGLGASGHATTVGRHFFGLQTSLAPGPTDIRAYEAGHWLANGFLRGTGSMPPKNVAPLKIFNHSWIGSPLGSKTYLRKLDFAIDEQELVVAYGVDNGSGPLTVPLLAQAFNGIAVGRSDGNHAHGTTIAPADGPGRMKPELVAPGSATSFATPLVAGAAALLVETAQSAPGLQGNPRALRPELLKAVLMAGAEKRAGWSNGAPQSGPQRGSTATPLDPVYGADEIDVNQSHWILTSLEQPGATTPVGLSPSLQRGWSVIPIDEGQSRFWRFTVSVEKPTVDAVVTWNRLVSSDFGGWLQPEVNLRLWRLDANDALVTLVGDAAASVFAAGNVESRSAVDNVELVHVEGLVPGEYALEVWRAQDFTFLSWDVALAWSMTCPEPTTYCTAKASTAGCVPLVSTQGFASAQDPNPFLVRADQVPNNKNGLLFYGFQPAALPFLGGTLCVQPPLRRTSIQDSSGNPPPDDCSGTFLFDLRALIQGGSDPNLAPGRDVFGQYWFRDPPATGGTGLSDAVGFSICQ